MTENTVTETVRIQRRQMGVKMSKVDPHQSSSLEASKSGIGAGLSTGGTSPYATGGGGVTFERKVAVQYLAHMLVGDNVTELGDGRRVVSVAFQQAPLHAVDDLIVRAAHPDELQPSLVLALGVRRSPKLVESDASTQKLIRQFVHAVTDVPTDGPEYRLGLVVSGSRTNAKQLAELAQLAAKQMDAPGFFDLVQKPYKFDTVLRNRLNQLEKLVRHALDDLGVVEAGTALVQEHTWQLLSRLTVQMPRLESPDETDWSGVVNNLTRVVRDSDLTTASQLRDRLVALASDYSPSAAQVDLTMLRRDSHSLLDPTIRRHQHGWRILNSVHRRACESVRAEITAVDGGRSICLDRNAATVKLLKTVSSAEAVVISGESGVGKSALAVLGLTAAGNTDPKGLQALCINLRHIPKLAIELEATLGHPLSTLLCELGAPQRILVVDGADAVTAGRHDAFRCLVEAAQDSGVKVIAVTSFDSKQVVLDALKERFDNGVAEHVVPPLDDSEIDEVVGVFTELERLNANPRSRDLLRRLVVVDLLVRGQIPGTPLTDADAMNEVWSGLVRRREMSDAGSPDAREMALLRLADLELGKGERLEVISGIDSAALDGLRRDGLLRTSNDAPFMIGPEFAHDEVRRYAIARLFLASDNPGSGLLGAGAPRWALAAARLACQAWLERPGTSKTPLKGRFTALQESFDALVEKGHGSRWGDVPGEALLSLGDCAALLREAWPKLLVDGGSGLRRLARLVDQRLRDVNRVVDVITVEPIITLLLEEPAPWQSGKYAEGLFRDWLHGHVIAHTAAGHPLRILLRQRLVEACAAGDRRLAEEREAAAAARAARTPEEVERDRQNAERNSFIFSAIGYGGRRAQRRSEIPFELKDEVILELLALLGPDIGEDGEEILTRVAKDAPSWLGPAVDDFFAAQALASGRRGLLAELTEAYYLDDEVDVAEFGALEDGVRHHRAKSLADPLAAWYRGPFMPLFQTDFRNGVRMFNRLLNHAARVRTGTPARLDHRDGPLETDSLGPYESELKITGATQRFVGDEHVWRWYRGTAVGPYACFSAFQALERMCDQLIDNGTPIKTLVTILLDGCENLAMVGFVVGLLVRHLEQAGHLLDPYLTEPLIWRQEFARVTNEASPIALDSKDVVAPDRRNWSLREAAMFMVVQASDERAAELRVLGETLIANARLLIEATPSDESADVRFGREFGDQQLVHVRAWASSLDRDCYQAHETQDGFYLKAIPPDDVLEVLQDSNKDLELGREATRLFVRYVIDPTKQHATAIGADELVADIAIARKLLEDPPSLVAHNPWDTAALVAAAALKAHFVDGIDLPGDVVSFAAEVVLQIGEIDARTRPYEFEGTFNEQGADRNAARALPLLLLPGAAQLAGVVNEEEGSASTERAFRAGVNVARVVSYEVRLQLARGLDPVWEAPCVEHGSCHHDLGWRIAFETIRRCLLGARDPETGRRSVLELEEPFIELLARAADDSIQVWQLDAAIRALAPAAMANICISSQAQSLLLTLLAAQRRSLLNCQHSDPDPRQSHSLVAARALLTMAKDADDTAIYDHIDAYANRSQLLSHLLHALSAAAEETPDRASTARRIWPNLVRHVLQLSQSGHTPFAGRHYGDMALGDLVPNTSGELPYLYLEVHSTPIVWWNPVELASEVEAWLAPAAGNATCVDRLIGFLSTVGLIDQVHLGLPWVARLVAAGPIHIARTSHMLPTWLIEVRSVAIDAGFLPGWQQVVDDLVVAGVASLAPYSD